jgi:acylphosphatase
VRLTRRIRVHGHVPGVWFRDWANREADRLGVDGWVRNRRDGTVEVLAAGEAQAVEALIERLHQGPPRARVDRLDIADVDEPVAPGFTQAATA